MQQLHDKVTRAGRRLATAALIGVLVLAGRGAVGPDGRELTKAEQRVVRVLRATRAKPPPPVAESKKLVARDAHAAVELLFDLLVERRVPAIDDLDVQRLSAAQEELALGGLRVIGRERVMRALEKRLHTSNGPTMRAAAIEVYGVFADANDLSTIVALASGSQAETLDARIDEMLQQTLTTVLTSDARAFDRLRAVSKAQSRDVISAIMFAVGAARDERGLPFLAEIMTWREDLAVEALSQIRLIGRSSSPEVDAELSQLARGWLDPTLAQRCRAAVMALGVLEDATAVPQILDLLEHDSSGMHDDVFWALRHISAQDLPPSQSAWTNWFDGEQSWYADEMPAHIAALASDDESEFASAVQALSQHRLYRHEIAQTLVSTLELDRPEFRVLVCAALADLGSNVALHALTEAVSDADERVAEAARAAILRIAGRDPRPVDQQQH